MQLTLEGTHGTVAPRTPDSDGGWNHHWGAAQPSVFASTGRHEGPRAAWGCTGSPLGCEPSHRRPAQLCLGRAAAESASERHAASSGPARFAGWPGWLALVSPGACDSQDCCTPWDPHTMPTARDGTLTAVPAPPRRTGRRGPHGYVHRRQHTPRTRVRGVSRQYAAPRRARARTHVSAREAVLLRARLRACVHAPPLSPPRAPNHPWTAWGGWWARKKGVWEAKR